jgi:putative transposase
VRTGSPGHLKTFDYLGPHRYSLTFCTTLRNPLFTTHAVVGLVLEQIARAADEQECAVIAYCFMPDHVHVLVEGKSADSDGKKFIARAKQYSGFYHKREHGSTLWQRYGFEHVPRDEELTLVVAKYILENPLRAGLVKRVEDYPFVGSLAYSLAELLEAIASKSG